MKFLNLIKLKRVKKSKPVQVIQKIYNTECLECGYQYPMRNNYCPHCGCYGSRIPHFYETSEIFKQANVLI